MQSVSVTFSTETDTGRRGSVNGISIPVHSQKSVDAITSPKDATVSASNTDALNRYALQFIEDGTPFCLSISPYQAHSTPYEFTPQEYYDRLPTELQLPENVPDPVKEQSLKNYQHYLAMTLTVDDMLGELMADLLSAGYQYIHVRK